MEDSNQQTQGSNPFVPEQTPNPTLPPAIENNGNFWKYIGIGMSIVSFCLAVGFIGYVYVLNKNTAKIENQNITTATPTPTPDSTANWQTYKGSVFSIRYPLEFVAKETGAEEVNFTQEDSASGSCKFVRISLVEPSQIDAILTTARTKSGTLSPIPQIKNPYINSVDKNITGFWIESGSENVSKDIFILNDTKYIRYKLGDCSGAGGNYKDYPEIENTTSLMISTFKFTD